MRRKFLSISQLRRRAKKRRLTEPEQEQEAEAEAVTETEKETELDISESAITGSLAGFNAWLMTKTSPASAKRILSHVILFFNWLANPLSRNEAAMFGKTIWILLTTNISPLSLSISLVIGWTALSVTAAVCRQPSLLEDLVERNLVGIRGSSYSTVLSYLSSFRRLFEWRKKQAEYDNELELIRPPAFASDIFSTMEELSVRYYI